MNNIIFQTIRAGVVLGVALFAFVGSASAAPTLLSASVAEITGTSAVLRGYFQNNGERTLVRFEWSGASSVSAPTVVGMKDTFLDGFFTARLEGLTPGVTYSYRAVASSGGVTTSSPVVSFKTLTQENSVSTGTSSLGVGPITSPAGTTKVVAQTNKKIIPVAETGQTATTLKDDGFTNSNTAAIIGAGDGMFPTTLVGWVALLVSILVAILIGRMIYESNMKRNKAREEEEREEAEEESKTE